MTVVFSVSMIHAAIAFAGEKITLNKGIEFERLTEHIWLHTTYTDYPGYGRTPANGLIVVDGATAAMIDTPWNDEQTGLIFDWAEQTLHVAIKHIIVGHAHEDCLGGLAEAHRRGAASYSLDRTQKLAKSAGYAIPQKGFAESLTVTLEKTELILNYFGGGHTVDNIVVWIPSEKTLFGGCLVKAAGSKNLGNTADADLKGWPETVKKVIAAFPDAEIIVPGHGAPGGQELLTLTLALSEAALQK